MAGMVATSVVWAALHVAGPLPVEAAAEPVVIPNRAVAVDQPPTSVDPNASETQNTTEATVEAPAPTPAPDPEAEARAAAIAAREALPIGRTSDGEAAGAAAAGRGWWGGSGMVQAGVSTAAVVLLIFGARWVIVRTSRGPLGASSVRMQLGAGGRAPSGLLFVLGRYPVGRGSSLVLIQLDRRVLLLSQSGAGFQTLAEISDAEEVASIIAKARDEEGESISARFSSLLRTFDRRHTDAERADDLRSVVRPVSPAARADAEDALDGPAEGIGDESPEAIRDRLSALKALVS